MKERVVYRVAVNIIDIIFLENIYHIEKIFVFCQLSALFVQLCAVIDTRDDICRLKGYQHCKHNEKYRKYKRNLLRISRIDLHIRICGCPCRIFVRSRIV
ncbi:unknown [Candidatus Apopatosoma intestinale]|nr:unknown [Candidatus Apopatosoma intestinale]